MDTKERARATARLLVNLARIGDADAAARIVGLLADRDGPRRERLRQVLTELLTAAAAMVIRQTGGHGEDTAVVLDLRGSDGSTVDVDELRPEVRAIVRALLAEIHAHREDLRIQLTFALGGESEGLVDGVSLVLLWTVSAMDWCEEHGEPAPGWLVTTSV
jgi:hypothetical protein